MSNKPIRIESEELERAMKGSDNRPNFSFKERDFKFTRKQQSILKSIFDDKNKIIIIDGPAGSSKSFLAIYAALTEFSKEKNDSILYLRTVIESASKSMGFLKGGIDEKLEPYRQVLDDKIEEIVEDKDQRYLINSSHLDAQPINFVRGSSWRDKFVILDEFQNATLAEAKTILTRLGEGSKLILCGDSQQADIHNSCTSGLKAIFDNEESVKAGIKFFQLSSKDVVRSEIVKFIVEKFEKLDI